jgi:hypothetical protein
MSTLTLPQARIPLAWVMVNGQRVPAEIDIEWMRALIGMVDRLGGVSGPANIVNYIQSTTTPPGGLSDEGGNEDNFYPGPQGQKGDKGEPGPAVWLLDDPIENDVFWRV